MKVIIGLGNPGKQYEKTRHNIGFQVIDELKDRWNVHSMQTKFNGAYATVHRPEGKVILVQPMTYMNLSGECVRPLIDYYGAEIEDIIVLYDDLDLPLGQMRLRLKGGAGGHNGMKSLIQHLGTQSFKRVRIGIGRPTGRQPIADYVLAPFSKEEQLDVDTVVRRAADACEDALSTDFNDVMNEYNR
ncbi:MAG TPA: aminoacyl-tRNA hydrolase [Savagea sp.]